MSETVAPDTTESWSWKRALAIAGGVAVVVGIMAFIAAQTLAPPGTDMHKLGEGTGRLIGVVFLIAFGGSYLLQTGRKVPAYSAFVFSVILGLMPVVLPLIVPGPPRVLEPAERDPFVVQADGTQLQPVVGLTVPSLPDRFEVQPIPEPGRDVANWLWASPGTEELVIVILASPQKSAPQELEGFIGGVTHGMLQRGVESASDFEATQVAPDRIEGTLRGVPFLGRGVAYTSAERHYMAVILVLSTDAALRESVTQAFGATR